MAGRPKKPKTALIRMKVGPRLYEYLTLLARDTVLGGDETRNAMQSFTSVWLGNYYDSYFLTMYHMQLTDEETVATKG